MTGWLIGLVLSGLGISALAAWLIVGGGGFLALAGLLRFIPTPAAIYRFFTSPVGVVLTMVAIGLGSFAWGAHRARESERAKCEARITASIEAAKRMDQAIAAAAQARAQVLEREAAAREAAIKSEVSSYVEQLATRTAQNCAVGLDADLFNDGLRVPDEQPGVPGANPPTPPRRPDSPLPRLVPQGKGQR